jgi:hypothetical protein
MLCALPKVRPRTRAGTGTKMARVWILDTSTKGTGATMVPLETVLRKPSGRSDPIYVPPPRPPKAPPPEEPRRPRMFKMVDVRSREVLVEDAPARATIEALNEVRSIIDVNVYVWEPGTTTWRLLTFDEQRLLWSHRGPTPAGDPGAGRSGERDNT